MTDTPHQLRIFLCHSSGDKPAVRKLYQRLLINGLKPWLDEEDLLPGQDWQQEIAKAVRNSDVVIVCLSQNSIKKSSYLQKEIKFALDVADEQPEGTIFLIPLKLEECEVPDRLNKLHWVNLFEDRGYERLFKALQGRAQEIGIDFDLTAIQYVHHSYGLIATSRAPALVIYLIDVSKSMGEELDGMPKIEHVNQAIAEVLTSMVERSTKGEYISPRYRLGLIAYSDSTIDLIGGIKTIDEVAKKGKPTFFTSTTTNTHAAFTYALELLKQEMPKMPDAPAPMVCHLTDGRYTGHDPEPVVRQILQMGNADGKVLVENIYLGPNLTDKPILNIKSWPGIMSASELSGQYAQKLFNMSSVLPESYANVIQEMGYGMQPGSRMIIPGTNQDLIELAFVMSGATPML
jgi:uncharacterized protein YegL